MHKGDVGALLGAAGGVTSALFAVWPGGMIEDGIQKAANNPEWNLIAHLTAGSLGILAMLIAHNRLGMARLFFAVGALLLTAMIFTEPFSLVNLFRIVLPALFLLLAALLISDVPATTSRSTGPASHRA